MRGPSGSFLLSTDASPGWHRIAAPITHSGRSHTAQRNGASRTANDDVHVVGDLGVFLLGLAVDFLLGLLDDVDIDGRLG